MQLRGAASGKQWKTRRRTQARTDFGRMLANGTIRRGEELKTWYVQWVRGEEEINQRLKAGWTFAQETNCHHNIYAVLMRAPEGWSP